jgi:hypothetical protein
VKAGRRSGHPARGTFAAELRDIGLRITAARHAGEADDTLTVHGTAALWTSAHGRVFTHPGTGLPGGLQPGKRGKCFENAQQAARSHGLRYVEGFAGPSPAGQWTLHAWNLDERGRVVDPTWGADPGHRGHYFGVVFDDLPTGEDAGISLIAQLLGGKLVGWDFRTGRLRVMDGGGPLADLVRGQGGAILA